MQQMSPQSQQQEPSLLPRRSPQFPQQRFSALPLLASASASSSATPDEPRSSPTRRGSTDEGGLPKKAKTSPIKKPRVERISEEMEANIRTIKLGDQELFTMDEPEVNPEDFAEQEISFEEDADVGELPNWLWFDGSCR